MKINGRDAVELINIDGWAILKDCVDTSMPGISHLKCGSWIRYALHPDSLECNYCGKPIPDGIVAVWLFLNSEYEHYYRTEQPI